MNNNIVNITNNIKSALADFFSSNQFSKVVLLVDENTLKHCLPILDGFYNQHGIIEIKSGEKNKNIYTCMYIWQQMTHYALDRKALLINLGGGVIGDMGGFCAATYKRGIKFINIPTTLLSQVDASVGGKLGIDFSDYKNHIGLFCNPEKVFIDIKFLDTLPENEIRSGFAEIIKHALIADRNYFEKIIAQTVFKQPWKAHTEHSVKIKSGIVKDDPKEAGLRKVLNFGHTIGHAIETYFLDAEKPLLHGEAIAVGMICESYLSTKILKLTQIELNIIIRYLIEIYGKVEIPKSAFEKLLELMIQDKKNESGLIKMSLLSQIGQCDYDIPVGKADIIDSLFYYEKLEVKFK